MYHCEAVAGVVGCFGSCTGGLWSLMWCGQEGRAVPLGDGGEGREEGRCSPRGSSPPPAGWQHGRLLRCHGQCGGVGPGHSCGAGSVPGLLGSPDGAASGSCDRSRGFRWGQLAPAVDEASWVSPRQKVDTELQAESHLSGGARPCPGRRQLAVHASFPSLSPSA